MSEDELKARFYREVFMSSAEAVLPKNLSNEWLNILLSQAQCMHDKNDASRFTWLVSCVWQILINRSNTGELAITEHDLSKYLNIYSMELSLEKINRVTGMQTSSATLETILTNRVIEMTTN